jgi:hypothetical protein
MSPKQGIPLTKSTYSSPLAAARSWTTPSWPEALNARGSRRARRMAISRNARPLIISCPLPSLIVAGVEQEFTARRRELVARDEFPEPGEEGGSLGFEHLYIVDMDRMRPVSSSEASRFNVRFKAASVCNAPMLTLVGALSLST